MKILRTACAAVLVPFLFAVCSGIIFPKDSPQPPASQQRRNLYSPQAASSPPRIGDSQFRSRSLIFPEQSSNFRSTLLRSPPIIKAQNSRFIGNNDAIDIFPNHDLISSSKNNFHEADVMESDESLQEEIRALDSIISMNMNRSSNILKRPQFDGSLTLFPTPSYSLLPDLGPLRQLFQWSTKTAHSYATCHACRVGLGLLLLKARTKTRLEVLMDKAKYACTFFNVASSEVCNGLVNRFGPTVHYIMTSRVDITANTFCGIVLQAQGCASAKLQTEWNIDLSYPATGSRRHGPRNSEFEDSMNPRSINALKVLHLTDIHLDPDYRPGANTDCKTELCCRLQDGVGELGNRAGYYGDYRRCDLPLHSLEEALRHISTTHPDIKLIYMTGDLVPHNIWSTDVHQNIETMNVATKVIRKYFPNTQLIPVLGNHEVHPVNLFSPPGTPAEFSTDYIYAAAAKAWTGWIPQESLHTFLHAGYYDVRVTEKFRVIVLNTNLCYSYNLWQVYQHVDPGGQLQWLTRELHKSEERGELVHILGHVPPSQEECWSVWSRNFYRIINRFSNTVKAQFYGHTHYDEFQLYYDAEDKGRAINPLWLGASLTPFTNLNPGYKIFTVDGARGHYSSWNVLDHETWIYNLTKANENSHLPPRWFPLYRATDAYGIPNVLPNNLNVFVHRMSSDVNAFNEYYRNYHKAAEVALKPECDTTCRKRILCRIVTPHYLDQTECLKIQSEVDGVVLPQKIFQRASTEPPEVSSTSSGILGIFGIGK